MLVTVSWVAGSLVIRFALIAADRIGTKVDFMNLPVSEIAGYTFSDPKLLAEALTHSSARKVSYDDHDSKIAGRTVRSGGTWNERMEFLGDSVLSVVISTALFFRKEHFKEGELSRIRAALVNEVFLASLARRLQLGERIKLGHGERKAGLDDQDSILADALEAVIAAVYLDGGFAAAQRVVEGLFADQLRGDVHQLVAHDYKTELQELIQAAYKDRPDYSLVSQSQEQAGRIFTVSVGFRGVELGRGSGLSKKNASQEAARMALEGDPLGKLKVTAGVQL
jgi:ribonuclease III